PEDRFENHIEDTLTAGAGLCDRAVVEMVVREAPLQINDLVRWGTQFDLENGQLALTREGGHSHRRIVHALGDATGHEVMRAIIDRAGQTPNLTLSDNTLTIDLLPHGGACVGAPVSRPGGDPRLSWAKPTILASGRCMDRTQHPNVYLDLSHLDPAKVRQRFPGIDKVCRSFGLDITRARIPVRPGAHYMIGGVTVDAQGRTTLPGLWAAGEVTSSGLHGANRLASNSLLEGLVFGEACGRGAARAATALPDRFVVPPVRSR